jgi:hypothetical protein
MTTTTHARRHLNPLTLATAVGLVAALALSCSGSSRLESFELTNYQSNKQATLDQYTDLDRGKTFKGISRVLIPSFQVEYIVSSGASASSYHIGRGNTSRVSSFFNLAGLDDDRVQMITDSLYAKFVSGLEAQGIEVLTLADLEAQPAWAKLKARGEPTPVLGKNRAEPKAGKSIVSTPTGFAVYLHPDRSEDRPGRRIQKHRSHQQGRKRGELRRAVDGSPRRGHGQEPSGDRFRGYRDPRWRGGLEDLR